MKKHLTICCAALALALLPGCRGSMFSSRQDMEHLRPVQTLGLDRQGDGVLLSISTGVGPDMTPALVMQAEGSGIEDAIARLQDRSPQDELFYAHVRYILLGQSMTDESILPLLDWVERSPAMRMDTPMLVVAGRAADAVIDASGEKSDVTERLASLEREERFRGRTVTNLRDTAAGLLEQGGALCTAVLTASNEPAGSSFPEAALLPAGYALLRSGESALLLTEEQFMGAAMAAGQLNGTRTEIAGNVLDITDAGVRVSGRWEDGRPVGIHIRCHICAGIVERDGAGETDPQTLTEALQQSAEDWVSAAAALSQSVGCDFLRLESGVFRAPHAFDPALWSGLFPELPVTVTAEAVIDRSYDLSS